MLDVISDFWKPMRKSATADSLQLDKLAIGSRITFYSMPQPQLSGKELAVGAVNTYQFGSERLTSFMLAQEEAPVASMIVAEADGEHYLALSRKLSEQESATLFDKEMLGAVMKKADVKTLRAQGIEPGLQGWTVPMYTRQIQGMKGMLIPGDLRGKTGMPLDGTQPFEYYLLVSDSNEHAIEIESMEGGKLNVYATVYRRISDIANVAHPGNEDGLMLPPKPEPAVPKMSVEAATPSKAEDKSPSKPEPKIEPRPVEKAAEKPVEKPVEKPMPAMAAPSAPARSTLHAAPSKPMPARISTNPSLTQKKEIKIMSTAPAQKMENDSVECDLKVANRIIDEAIRADVRLTDVVRKVIDLPVAYPESVQIPITLSDDDYALLAKRYGISAGDKDAIRRKIAEDLNNFSGKK